MHQRLAMASTNADYMYSYPSRENFIRERIGYKSDGISRLINLLELGLDKTL